MYNTVLTNERGAGAELRNIAYRDSAVGNFKCETDRFQ